MRRQARANGGLSLPYILIQTKAKQNDPPRKLLIPKSMPALKQSAMKALKLTDPIVSICDRNGREIQTIGEIKAGQLLLMDTNKSASKPQAPVATLRRIRQDTTSEESSEAPSPKLHSSPSSVQQQESPQKPVMPPQQVLSEDEYVYEEEEEEEEDERDEIQKLFDEAAPGSRFRELEEVLSEISPDCKDFLENARRIEEKQKLHWAKGLIGYAKKCEITCDPERIMAFDRIKAKAAEVVQNHHLATPLGVHSVMNLVVTGPRSSGKTTFLSVLLKQFLQYLVGEDTWKSTFVVIINFDDFVSAICDPKALYLRMARVTVSLLIAQLPVLIPHERLLTKYFEKIVAGGYLPLLPKRFVEARETAGIAAAFRSVAEAFMAAWSAPTGGDKWATQVFMLPILLAQELGFSNILYFADNVDMMNVPMSVAPQFNDSDDVYLGEPLKKALKLTNFAIACKDVNQFESMMIPVEDTSVDLEPVLEYVSVLDVECDVEYENQEIYARIRQEKFKITSMHFGKAPGFVHHWITINRIFDRLDECEEDSEEYEDYLAAALSEVQKAIPLIFEADGQIGEVDEVRRRQCSS